MAVACGGVLIVAATLVAYHNSWHGPFVFDDASSIVTNPTLRQLWPPGPVLAGPVTNVTAQGRPVLNLSLALNHAFGGTAVEGYHLVNAFIHALAALTLFGLVRRTLALASSRSGTASRSAAMPGEASLLALTIAVLWAVHPLQTESVTYVIQRAESLVGLFYLLTLYCFARGVGQVCDLPSCNPSKIRAAFWLVPAVISCLLGMATKEVMATAPLLVLFYDRCFVAGTFAAAWRRRRSFYVALAATWLPLAWLVAQTGGNRGGSVGFGVGVGWWDYWLTQFQAIPHYLRLALWPEPLVFEYGAFWIHAFGEIALGVAVVFALLGATIWALYRRHPAGFLGAWFFGILAPTSLAPGTTQMIVEHRMYLPLAAVIALVIGALHARLGRLRLVAGGLAAASAVALILVTVARNEDYRTEIALWADTVAKRPANPLAHYMLAGAQERAGNVAGALASYAQTLELKPDFSIGHENFGELLLRQGRRDEAIDRFESALRLQPNFADAHANLGLAYLAENRLAEAVAHLERAVQLVPDSALRRHQYANALVACGLAGEAIPEFETALRREPDFAEAHFALANVLLDAQRVDDAVAHYEAAIRAKPDYAAAHNNLANALFAAGRLADAARHYEETLRIAPGFPHARESLEAVRARMSR